MMTDRLPVSSLSDPRRNHFLARLAPQDYEALMANAEIVSLKFRRKMLEQDAVVDAVYFPITCMFSLLVTIDDEPQLELATIGKEGIVGAAEIIHKQGSMGFNLIQIPGSAVRIEAKAFRRLIAERPQIEALVFRHLLALLRQILYGAACNRLHSMEQRCARWMLMTHDRAGEDTFPLTQEFLANMLGVRRATVNVATGMLKKAGFIRYVR